MHTLLLFALTFWPFTPAKVLNQHHSRRFHAARLEHVQHARAQRLNLNRRHRAAHPSLVRF